MSALSHQSFANTTTPYWVPAGTPASLLSPLAVVDNIATPTKKTTISTTSGGLGSVVVANQNNTNPVSLRLQQGATQLGNTITLDVGNVNPALRMTTTALTSSLPVVIDSPLNAQDFTILPTPGGVAFQMGSPGAGGSTIEMANAPVGGVSIMQANLFSQGGLEVDDKVGGQTFVEATTIQCRNGNGTNIAKFGVSGTAAYIGVGDNTPTFQAPGLVVNPQNGCELRFSDGSVGTYAIETTAGNLVISTSTNPAAMTIDPAGQVSIPDILSGSFVPIGGIVMWSGGVLPVNWRLCDGTLGTPDLRDRFIIGAGSFALGTIGGSSLISISNLPPHNHIVNDPGHTHSTTAMSENNQGQTGLAGGRLGNNQGNTSSTGFTGIDLGLTGSGTAYYQPYYALAFIIRVA